MGIWNFLHFYESVKTVGVLLDGKVYCVTQYNQLLDKFTYDYATILYSYLFTTIHLVVVYPYWMERFIVYQKIGTNMANKARPHFHISYFGISKLNYILKESKLERIAFLKLLWSPFPKVISFNANAWKIVD